MKTSDVCRLLNCTSRTVFTLRRAVYPEGHHRAGQCVLGNITHENGAWHYDAEAVYQYRNWLIAGKPLAPPMQTTVDRCAIAQRMRRSMV